MGALHIDGVGPIQIEDELLDHIFIVVTSKLRRREPVLLSWTDDAGQEQRVFLSEKAIIRAEFDSPTRVPRDRDWLDRLMIAANSNAGLSVSAAMHDRGGTRVPTEHAPPTSTPNRREARP